MLFAKCSPPDGLHTHRVLTVAVSSELGVRAGYPGMIWGTLTTLMSANFKKAGSRHENLIVMPHQTSWWATLNQGRHLSGSACMQLGFSSFITNSRGIQIKSSVEEISVEQKEQGTVSPNCSEEVIVTLQKESPGNKDIYSDVCVCLCLSESDREL